MYKHLLLPTDGSPLSEDAVRRGAQFARQLGAKVTCFYALPETEAFETQLAFMLEHTEVDTKSNPLSVLQQHDSAAVSHSKLTANTWTR